MDQTKQVEQPSPRLNAMLDALVQQRNQSADEIVRLVGDLAEMQGQLAAAQARIAELEEKLRASGPGAG